MGTGPPGPAASPRIHHDLTGGGIGDERTANTNGIEENSMNRTPFSCGAEAPISRGRVPTNGRGAPAPESRELFQPVAALGPVGGRNFFLGT